MESAKFDMLWDNVIKNKATEFVNNYGSLYFQEECKTELYVYYAETSGYARNHYMLPHEDGSKIILNRYKVAAAMLIAILKTKPLKKIGVEFYKEPLSNCIFNEELALHVALVIIRQYIMNDIKTQSGKWTQEQLEVLETLFKQGIPIEKAELESWEKELYYVRHEGCYSLLLIAKRLEDYVTILLLKEQLQRALLDKHS